MVDTVHTKNDLLPIDWLEELSSPATPENHRVDRYSDDEDNSADGCHVHVKFAAGFCQMVQFCKQKSNHCILLKAMENPWFNFSGTSTNWASQNEWLPEWDLAPKSERLQLLASSDPTYSIIFGHFIWHVLGYVIYLTYILTLTCYLTFHLTIAHICSDIGILSGILSDILSGIVSAIYSDMFCGIL